MSNRGLWMMLGAAGLSGLLAVACGGSDSDSPSGTTAAGGATGKAGSGNKAGSSTAGGGGSTANGGTSAGGTSAGGKAGTSAGGSTSQPQPPTPGSIGKACSSDAACGTGGTCIKTDSTDFLGVGAPNGYCSMDCTDFLKKAITDPNTAGDDPCGDGASCLNFGTGDGVDKAKGVCVQLCTFGSPELAFEPPPDDKCRGREDVGCFPLHESETDPKVTPKLIRATIDGKDVPVGFCRPLCTDDTSCKSGYKCDLGSGGCIPKGTKCQQHETKCDPTLVDAAGDNVKQCEGLCVSIYGSDAPADKQKIGICMDPCAAGNTAACDGQNGQGAFCGLYNLYGYDGEGRVDVGVGDQAVCGWFASSGTSDNECGWEAGSFVRTFKTQSQPIPICVISSECTSNDDCTYECKTAADCETGDSCTGGKCIKADGTPNTGGNSCTEVAELGAKFCLDHKPTGLKPKGSPGCTGAGGAGGSAGAAGAGGAAAGAGGAAAGAGGAAAGAGGAAAGAGGDAGAGGAAAGAGGDAGAGGSAAGSAGAGG